MRENAHFSIKLRGTHFVIFVSERYKFDENTEKKKQYGWLKGPMAIQFKCGPWYVKSTSEM